MLCSSMTQSNSRRSWALICCRSHDLNRETLLEKTLLFSVVEFVGTAELRSTTHHTQYLESSEVGKESPEGNGCCGQILIMLR